MDAVRIGVEQQHQAVEPDRPPGTRRPVDRPRRNVLQPIDAIDQPVFGQPPQGWVGPDPCTRRPFSVKRLALDSQDRLKRRIRHPSDGIRGRDAFDNKQLARQG